MSPAKVEMCFWNGSFGHVVDVFRAAGCCTKEAVVHGNFLLKVVLWEILEVGNVGLSWFIYTCGFFFSRKRTKFQKTHEVMHVAAGAAACCGVCTPCT